MAVSSIIIGAGVSFSIAWLGWNKLEKRAEKTSLRSESFSLLGPTITLISEFREMAENSLYERSSSSYDPISSKDKLIKRQGFDIKFHAKYQLLKTKLAQLQTRGISIPEDKLVELRMAFTTSEIDNIKSYSIALNASDRIEVELYSAFERTYPKSESWVKKYL
ncbi:hypothetical protein VITU102760_20045 [Vibrio tubiashii]|uniref:Uncharacterized protein n=1 Tax=Vibrio tubiashii ATCC 19109 TaxID=1051646 RepID=F9TCA0_9VIBR|nr:hypothetical protein [Vibrio tubiashii]AIW12892.1 hypothetical protein IX91_01430 [Vibrio tubiashii ATCC 19109]EGU47958.1 hypothetical protein VITU9109_22721 [Vibrio tubiashii ATCC 19109]EIF03389.1 hypothetical protein VT1337_13707 [Vibrio tubiashii NCIMB 1337 = ATCC 19106]